jgi:anti-sigma regulatory factor (Ser/Thr protein kinase)
LQERVAALAAKNGVQGGVVDTACGPSAPTAGHAQGGGYRHEAFFYDGMESFLDGTLRFIGEAVQKAEPVFVVVSNPKIAALQKGLNGSGSSVTFASMDEVGRNPGRIISAWQDFLLASSGSRVHGIGEPIWAERAAAELVECQQHEALLNLAFTDRDFRLMCPYDTTALSETVLQEALRTHPLVYNDGRSTPSLSYPGDDAFKVPCGIPLPGSPTWALSFEFHDEDDLLPIRQFVAHHAALAGLSGEKMEDLVIAANEMVTNSLRYGGHHKTIQVWREAGSFICEISDGGRIDEPMIGRLQPPASDCGGRGFWLAQRLCDLVQVRVFDSGSVVRLHSYIPQHS